MSIKNLIKTIVFLVITGAYVPAGWADSATEATDSDSASEGLVISAVTQYFKPIKPSAPSAPTTTTGTRTGGCFSSSASPNLMAPTTFVGETATNVPTLTWFFPDEMPVPVELNLYALQPSGVLALHHSSDLAYEPGVSQYALPTDAALEPNQSYLWQMILHCNPNRPSQSLVYEAEVEFVPSTVALSSMGSAIEQARELAKTGYWYDAITALGTSEAPEIEAVRSVLLNDLNLLEAAMKKESPD